MKIGMRKARVLAGVVVAASLAAPLAPAAQADSGEWVVIAEFTAPAPAVDVMGTAFAEVFAAVEAATGAAPKSCVPTTSNYPDRLEGQALLNFSTGEIKYKWFGPGYAFATKNCASGVTVNVVVTDLAAAGSPTRVRGPRYSATSNYNSTKSWGATRTTAQPEVLYYGPSRIYQRGNSVVFISVSGSYKDKATGRSMPLPCRESATQVTPTPTGPIFGAVTSGPCGNSEG